MFILVSYDVSTLDDGGAKRLRRVAKLCKNYGQRVQFSVFECIVDPARWEFLRQNLIDEINEETDSLRFYFWDQIGETKLSILVQKKELIRKACCSYKKCEP